ncbi:MAG TPA: UvrD-helicase domain-containing protein [Mucilaginibacter sp.]|jgi:DNA helicase-4|nr:UvrD-helicase domain-containing protein [Mucilaginibacter sp.]
MPHKSRFDIITVIKVILLCLSIAGIWYVYQNWLKRKKLREELPNFRERFKAAIDEIDKLFSFEKYYSFRDETIFIPNYSGLRNLVPTGFERIGLPEDLTKDISRFVDTFDRINSFREKYNDDFVKLESEKFSDFFGTLEAYPLSPDQVEANIRDEDNNLVIAGAGTGKTTTIAGKVAYLLKKGLATPEALLIISFTKNAVNEMRERCLRFCRKFRDPKNWKCVRSIASGISLNAIALKMNYTWLSMAMTSREGISAGNI